MTAGGDSLRDLIPEILAPQTLNDTRRAALEGLLDALSARPGERAEDVLLDLELIDDERLALALALRSGLPYQGLRGFVPDNRLFLYFPLAVARAQRILPLVLIDDTLTLATAFVDADLAVLRERFPNLRLTIVISPRREILEALTHVAG